jgi:hypothetical protein
MRRTLVIAAVLAATGALAPTTGFAGGAAVAVGPSATLAACTTGPTPLDRSATFTGSMTAAKGTRRMWMRFDLFERSPGSRGFRRVKAANFGAWERSRRGVPAFTFAKRVDGLAAPASYRVVVRFRWHGARGRIVRQASRRSAICRQRDPRPDLAVGRVVAARAPDAERVRYVVTVRNRGRGDAAVPFGVVLTVEGRSQPPQEIATLGAGGEAIVSFVAARCAPGSQIRIAVDPDGAIDEVHEDDNVVTRPCPAGP